MMGTTDRDYLKRMLISKQIEQREINVQHRIEIAEYNIKYNFVGTQIDSLERQITENPENAPFNDNPKNDLNITVSGCTQKEKNEFDARTSGSTKKRMPQSMVKKLEEEGALDCGN